jgi:hypothetical protein
MSEYRLPIVVCYQDDPNSGLGEKAYRFLLRETSLTGVSSLSVANKEFLRRYPSNMADDGRSKGEHIKEIRAEFFRNVFQKAWPTGRFEPGSGNTVRNSHLVFPDDADFIMFKLTHL